MKYFVRFEYTYHVRSSLWEEREDMKRTETDSAILSTEKEFEHIYEVQDALKTYLKRDEYFNIIDLKIL